MRRSYGLVAAVCAVGLLAFSSLAAHATEPPECWQTLEEAKSAFEDYGWSQVAIEDSDILYHGAIATGAPEFIAQMVAAETHFMVAGVIVGSPPMFDMGFFDQNRCLVTHVLTNDFDGFNRAFGDVLTYPVPDDSI